MHKIKLEYPSNNTVIINFNVAFNRFYADEEQKTFVNCHGHKDHDIDVFSVHGCFLFSNFHFQQLDITELKEVDPFEQKSNSINLYPQCVIHDNM